MMRRVALLAALAVAAAACGGSSTGSSTGSSATSATSGAVPRGTVVLITHDSFAASDAVLAAFTRESGWKVKVLKAGDAGAMVNQAILTKDHPLADALYGIDNTFLTRGLDAGLFVPYRAKGSDRVRPRLLEGTDGQVTPIDYGDVCLNYDTRRFGGAGQPPPPRSLGDLLETRYRGMTVVENPATSSPGLAFLLATVARYGEGHDGWTSYWKRLRANDAKVVSGWEQAYDGDFSAGGGNGTRPIVVSYASSPPADVVYSDPHRDVPHVGVVEASCFRQVEYAGVLRGAKHPAGAKALVDFMLTRRFQDDMPLQMYVFPSVSDATLPAVFRRWAAVPKDPFRMTPSQIGRHRKQWIEEWTSTVLG